jgi:hypothetical protein
VHRRGGCGGAERRRIDKARPKAFTAAQVKSQLARKPYDFRHAGISLRLNAGTPATQVAEWAGHSVEVLERVYAHCLDGHDERWFEKIDATLVGWPGAPVSPPGLFLWGLTWEDAPDRNPRVVRDHRQPAAFDGT